MQIFRILHMGDLHRPKRRPQVDNKRQLLSQASVTRAGLDQLRAGPLGLPSILARYPVDLVLFAGDVTDHGDYPGLVSGCDYLDGLWRTTGFSPSDIVPAIGNHDVARKGRHKFAMVQREWTGRSYRVATARPHIRKRLISGGPRTALCTVNSCLGAGEVHRYPEPIAKAVQKWLKDLRKDPDQQGRAKEIEKTLFDELDVPIIPAEHIDLISSELASVSVLLFQAHHNIVPNPIARISVCPELVTAGYLRRKLLGMDMPILYFHGHTHMPVVDVLRDPDKQRAILICIGVSEFPLGFNLVDLVFTKTRLPIAVISRTYYLSPDRYEYLVSTSRSVCLLPEALRRDQLGSIGQRLLALNIKDETRFRELMEKLSDLHIGTEDLAQELELLCALEYAVIINPDKAAERWIVEWRG